MAPIIAMLLCIAALHSNAAAQQIEANDNGSLTVQGTEVQFQVEAGSVAASELVGLREKVDLLDTHARSWLPRWDVSSELGTAVVGQPFSASVKATQDDGHALKYTLVSGTIPNGLSLNLDNNGMVTVSGTAAEFAAEINTRVSFVLLATDQVTGRSVSNEFFIQLADKNDCAGGDKCSGQGKCIDQHQGHTCECNDGFTGNDCSQPVTACSSSPCAASGQCKDVNGGKDFRCECEDGYSGNFCEVNIDDCKPNPCKNNGICTDGEAQYTCDCSGTGFQGATCEDKVDFCSDDCLNGATCVSKATDFECQCAPGFFGPLCANDKDECADAPCSNGGTCTNVAGTFHCKCAEGFYGPTCADQTADCEVGDWADESDKVCGNQDPCFVGSRLQRREVTKQPAGGGKPCPELVRSVPCDTSACTKFLVNVAHWGLPTASSQHSVDRSAWNLVDGRTDFLLGNDWLAPQNQGIGSWVKIDLYAPVEIVKIGLYNQNEYSGSNSRDIKEFDLHASNDDASWTLIMSDTLPDSQHALPNPQRLFSLDQPLTYRYWRLTVKSAHYSNPYLGLMEFELFSHLVPSVSNIVKNPTMFNWARTAKVTTSSDHNSERNHFRLNDGYKKHVREFKNQGGGNIVMDWLTAGGQRDGAWAAFDLGEAHTISLVNIHNQLEYSNSKRDAKTVMLQKSDNGVDWVNIQQMSIPAPARNYLIFGSQQLDPPVRTRYFRVRIDAYHSSDGYGGLTEVELLGPNNGEVHFKDVTGEIDEVISSDSYRPVTRLFDGKTDFGVNGADNWLSDADKRDGMTATLKFQDPKALRKFTIWQSNQANYQERDAREFSIGVANSNTEPIEYIYSGTLARAPAKSDRGNFPQDFYLPTSLGAFRQWTLRLDSFWGGGAYGGLMELKVYEDPVASAGFSSGLAWQSGSFIVSRSLASLVGRAEGVPEASLQIVANPSLYPTTVHVANVDAESYARPLVVSDARNPPSDLFVLQTGGVGREGELDLVTTGRIGVGTFEPHADLHVRGTLKLESGRVISTAGGLRVRHKDLQNGFKPVGLIRIQSMGLYTVEATVVGKQGYQFKKWMVKTAADPADTSDVGTAALEVVMLDTQGSLCDLTLSSLGGMVALSSGCLTGTNVMGGSVLVRALFGDDFVEF